MDVFSKNLDSSSVILVSKTKNSVSEGVSIVTIDNSTKKCLDFSQKNGLASNCSYIVQISSKNNAYAIYNTDYKPFSMKYTIDPVFSVLD
jgi:hypothetical protein